MEVIEKVGKYIFGDITVRQCSCHEKAHIKLARLLAVFAVPINSVNEDGTYMEEGKEEESILK